MKHRILPAAFMFFVSLTAFSQGKQYLYYFDKDFNPADKTQSFFNGTGVYENGKLELKIYHTLSKKLVMVEHYTDSSLTVTDGLSQTYYKNGSMEEEGNFVKGKEDGLWKRWDSAGHMIDSSVYNNGEKVIEAHTGYYKNGSLNSFVVNDLKADRLNKTYYDDKGIIKSEVGFTGQIGIVKYYDKGILSKTDSVTTREEIEASFRSGESAWTQYITRQLAQNIDKLTSDGKSGTCIVRFIVEKDGKVKNAKAITMKGSRLAEVAVEAILNGPKWKPAMQYGRPVKAYREQPISFNIQ